MVISGISVVTVLRFNPPVGDAVPSEGLSLFVYLDHSTPTACWNWLGIKELKPHINRYTKGLFLGCLLVQQSHTFLCLRKLQGFCFVLIYKQE